TRSTGGPAGQAGKVITDARPTSNGAGVLAVGLAGVAKNPASAGLPGGHDRSLVFVQGYGRQVGLGAKIAEGIAADRARDGDPLASQGFQSRSRAYCRRLVHEC